MYLVIHQMWLNLTHLIFFRSQGLRNIKIGGCEKTLWKICPEMHANEIHELYDRHRNVFPNLNS